MNKSEDFQQFLKAYGERIFATLTKKREDYAGMDPLSNFKFASRFAGISPAASIRNQIGIKIARLDNLLNESEGHTPNFESLSDTRLDLIGYLILWEYQVQNEYVNPISSSSGVFTTSRTK